MRLVITICGDLVVQVRQLQAKRDLAPDEAVKEAIRHGLNLLLAAVPQAETYRLNPRDLGRCRLPNLDHIADALAEAEKEAHK